MSLTVTVDGIEKSHQSTLNMGGVAADQVISVSVKNDSGSDVNFQDMIVGGDVVSNVELAPTTLADGATAVGSVKIGAGCAGCDPLAGSFYIMSDELNPVHIMLDAVCDPANCTFVKKTNTSDDLTVENSDSIQAESDAVLSVHVSSVGEIQYNSVNTIGGDWAAGDSFQIMVTNAGFNEALKIYDCITSGNISCSLPAPYGNSNPISIDVDGNYILDATIDSDVVGGFSGSIEMMDNTGLHSIDRDKSTNRFYFQISGVAGNDLQSDNDTVLYTQDGLTVLTTEAITVGEQSAIDALYALGNAVKKEVSVQFTLDANGNDWDWMLQQADNSPSTDGTGVTSTISVLLAKVSDGVYTVDAKACADPTELAGSWSVVFRAVNQDGAIMDIKKISITWEQLMRSYIDFNANADC